MSKCLSDGADEYLQMLSLCSVIMQQSSQNWNQESASGHGPSEVHQWLPGHAGDDSISCHNSDMHFNTPRSSNFPDTFFLPSNYFTTNVLKNKFFVKCCFPEISGSDEKLLNLCCTNRLEMEWFHVGPRLLEMLSWIMGLLLTVNSKWLRAKRRQF